MRRFPLVVTVVIAAFGLAAAAAPKKAGPPAAKPAPQAAAPKGDPYSVTVPVEASAASASAAQNNAINGGRARAWGQISHRLVPQKDWGKLPPLDDAGLERLIRGYTVADEKRSTTRYMAKVTYIFNPGAVKHLLRVANIGSAEQGGVAILLVAMSPSYSPHSGWAEALAQSKPQAAAFPLVTPLGDEVDESSLGPLRFGGASWGQVQSSASRVRAGEAVLLQASNPAASHMTVRMRSIGPGRPVAIADIDIPIPSGTPPQKAYAAAASQAEAAIEEAWKTRGSIDSTRKARLVAEVRIGSLGQWAGLLNRLSTVPTITDVSVLAMNTGEARVAISYTGTPDQLRTLAGQSNLTFAERSGAWWISPGRPSADDTDTQQ